MPSRVQLPCEVCTKPVAARNLARHLRRVHGWAVGREWFNLSYVVEAQGRSCGRRARRLSRRRRVIKASIVQGPFWSWLS